MPTMEDLLLGLGFGIVLLAFCYGISEFLWSSELFLD